MYMRTMAALVALVLSATPSTAAVTWDASWYGPGFHGKKMANGRPFNQNAMTVAHKTLPFGTKLKLTNPDNGRVACVVVTDRGPYIRGRELDVAKAVAVKLDFINAGTADLTVDKNGC